MKALLDWAVVGELSWFFSGAAEADAGVRSVQGGFEATMNRLALCGRPAKGHAELRGTEEVWFASGPVRRRRRRSPCPASRSRRTPSRNSPSELAAASSGG